MEYLVKYGFSVANISNDYITAIRSMLIIYGADLSPLRDQRIPLFVKLIKINTSFKKKTALQLQLDEATLYSISLPCDSLIFTEIEIFKNLYLYFFSFLFLSNLLPHYASNFDMCMFFPHNCGTNIVK